ncbi:MAG: hypothetical protein LKI53_02000 [Bacteroidales bacterium]|nr:hypothetical protein [Bacteroidales bacterium]
MGSEKKEETFFSEKMEKSVEWIVAGIGGNKIRTYIIYLIIALSVCFISLMFMNNPV